MARKGSSSGSALSALDTEHELVLGKVKWFNDDKGYGFIERDDRGKDVFVHFSGIVEPEDGGRRTLQDGDNVEFIVVDSEKGPKADNVRLR